MNENIITMFTVLTLFTVITFTVITFTVITLFTVITFAIYIELSPSMGNIWYRYDSDNVKRIQLIGLINLMAAPLTNQYMWRIEMWDINIFIWLIIALGTMYCITHNVLHEHNV